MLINFYPIHTSEKLSQYLNLYIPLVLWQMAEFKIVPKDYVITGDHLGVQTLSGEEFDACHLAISAYAEVISQGIIHNRRNNVYKLHQLIDCMGIQLEAIEIFEPKPDAELKKLKPGIEHIALTVKDFDKLLMHFTETGLPIDKVNDLNGSKFFKTKFVNLVEIEFRNDHLHEILKQKEIK